MRLNNSRLLASVALPMAIAAAAFFNANSQSKIFIHATPQNSDLDQAGFEALTPWVEIKGIGSRGEQGKTTNMLEYPTWDTKVSQFAKGLTRAGQPPLEVARIPTDAGQVILRAAGDPSNNNNYAFKEVRNDGTTPTNGSVIYNRGLIGGPTRPGGRNEDFDLEVFQIAYNQAEVVVNPLASGVPPTNTVAPAITGTAQVSQTLNLSNGTFTGDAVITYLYQWFAGGVAIPGAINNTFVVTSAQLGKVITARVHASNASGSAFGFTAPTSAVIA